MPAVIVAGRSDTLVPVNHAARAYAAFNSKVEAGSNLRYYEIVNGQHFDAFIPSLAGGAGINGYDVLFVPVHYYFINAMDILWARLKNNAPLPREPGGAHDPARRHAGRGAADHRRQRAEDRGHAGRGEHDQHRRGRGQRAELIPRRYARRFEAAPVRRGGLFLSWVRSQRRAHGVGRSPRAP